MELQIELPVSPSTNRHILSVSNHVLWLLSLKDLVPVPGGYEHGLFDQRLGSRGYSVLTVSRHSSTPPSDLLTYSQCRLTKTSQGVPPHLNRTIAINGFQSCLSSVWQVVWSDTNHVPIFPMEFDTLPYQFPGHSIVDPDDMSCYP